MEKIRVIISNQQKAVKIPTGIRMLIRRCCHAVLQLEGFKDSAEISVSFVDNDQIQEMNRQYRNIDAPTDVLSFPMFELAPGTPPALEDVEADPGSGLVPLGDMVLSLERAKAQGEEYGHGARRETAYLAVHSVLHLLGYDHLDEGEQKRRMRAREETILGALGIPRETAEG